MFQILWCTPSHLTQGLLLFAGRCSAELKELHIKKFQNKKNDLKNAAVFVYQTVFAIEERKVTNFLLTT